MLIGTIAIGGDGFADVLEKFSVKASAADITSYSVGDIIEFGSYPQGKVTDSSVISFLNSVAGDNSDWTSYGYYSGTGQLNGRMTAEDYMRYTDIIYNNNKYRGVVFDTYRPYVTRDTTSTSAETYQDNNIYNCGTVYWFKYEPIKWRVLDPSTGLVMAETILDSQAFNNCVTSTSSGYYGDSDCTYYPNNYAESSIREWLNNDFCNTAFSSAQQDMIQETTLVNSAYSTSYSQYDSASTIDKIYLLSYSDVLTDSYGFDTSADSSTKRKAVGSEYAKCQGLYVDSGYSYWSLRSAGFYEISICCVSNDGSVGKSFEYYGNYYTYNTNFGIRPALNLNLSSEIIQSSCVTVGVSLSIGADLSLTLSVNKDEFEGTPKIVFSRPTQIGGTRTDTIEGVAGDADKGQDTAKYYFNYTGIYPQFMADTITMNVYDDDKIICYNTTSIRELCIKYYEATLDELGFTGDDAYDKRNAMTVLLSCMLNYGSETQKYVGYNTGDLANTAYMAYEQLYYESVPSSATKKDTTENTATDNKITSAYCHLDNTVQLRFKVKITDANKIVISDGTSEKIFTGDELVTDENSFCIVATDDIQAIGFDTVYTVSVYSGETITNQIKYSVNSYCYAMQNSSTTGNLAKKMYAYGISATEYSAF